MKSEGTMAKSRVPQGEERVTNINAEYGIHREHVRMDNLGIKDSPELKDDTNWLTNLKAKFYDEYAFQWMKVKGTTNLLTNQSRGDYLKDSNHTNNKALVNLALPKSARKIKRPDIMCPQYHDGLEFLMQNLMIPDSMMAPERWN